jgi:hypothetical protein
VLDQTGAPISGHSGARAAGQNNSRICDRDGEGIPHYKITGQIATIWLAENKTLKRSTSDIEKEKP